MSARLVNCPRCGSPVKWEAGNPYRPFCSRRCRLFDLGAWASESYRIPIQSEGGDEENAPDGEPK